MTEYTVYDDHTVQLTDGVDNEVARQLALSLVKDDNVEMNPEDVYVLRVYDNQYIMEFFPDEEVVHISSGTL